jgi:hypothetical protein
MWKPIKLSMQASPTKSGGVRFLVYDVYKLADELKERLQKRPPFKTKDGEEFSDNARLFFLSGKGRYSWGEVWDDAEIPEAPEEPKPVDEDEF